MPCVLLLATTSCGEILTIILLRLKHDKDTVTVINGSRHRLLPHISQYCIKPEFFLRIETSIIKTPTKTRGPRGPWNAHLRVKIFKSSLFSLLYIQQATPGGV